MSHRDDALVAVLVAARALRASTQLAVPAEPRGVVVAAPLLAQLYAAIEAVDAVGAVDRVVPDSDRCADRHCWCWTVGAPVGPCGHQEARSAAQAAETVIGTARRPEGRTAPVWVPDLPECSTPDCFRAADLPTGTCHHHSEIGQAPLPFERARMRDPARGGHDAE
jgi:hypothetical protein